MSDVKYIDSQSVADRYGRGGIPGYLANLEGTCEREYRQFDHLGCHMARNHMGNYLVFFSDEAQKIFKRHSVNFKPLSGVFTDPDSCKDALNKLVRDLPEVRADLESLDDMFIREHIKATAEKYDLEVTNG